MAEGTCGAYTAIGMESATDPLISQTVEGQGRNNSLGAEPGVANVVESAPKERQEQQKICEPKDFLSRFNAIFDNTTSTKQEKKKSFETLLIGKDVKLKNIYVQKAFVKMLNDIAKYAEFWELFIKRVAGYNEHIEAKYLPTDDTNKDKTKKQRRPIIKNDPRPMRVFDAPLHCAVRQLNKKLIKWLLNQPETDVNVRNGRKETALAILCVMYDWCKEGVPKLKTRLEDIEKERETADKMQQIWLDDEKIEVSALKKKLTTNAPTILNLIEILQKKGADFNIYMNDGALPFDLLWKYYKIDVDVAHFIDSYVKPNVVMTEEQQKSESNGKSKVQNKSEVPLGVPPKLEGKEKSKKRVVKFYKKTEDTDIFVTVELLEIFMCYNDFENFKRYWNDFEVTSHNVKKVITLLVNVAVKQNYTNYVEHIMKKASKEIFLKLEENKIQDSKTNRVDLSEGTPMDAEVLSRCCCFKRCQKRHSHTPSEAIELEDLDVGFRNIYAITVEPTPMSDEPTSWWRCFKMFQKKQKPSPPNISSVKEEKLAHHAELKGLLKTVCENGNNALLKLFLFKINDRRLLNEHPLLILTIQKMSKVKENQEIKYFQDCAMTLIENHGKIRMQDTDPNKNTALHLALQYENYKIASLLLKEGHGLMGLMNKQNLTPIEYGTTEFWNNYLDNCITIKDKTELRFNVGFLGPLAKEESSYVKPSKASNVSKSHLKFVKLVAEMSETHNSKYRFTRTVNDMTALRLISQSTDRKEFLMHPVIIAFITMKWKRLFHWHILNLLLTTFTMGTFIAYTLIPCPSGGLTYRVMAGVGAFIILIREIMQLCLLGWSYFRLENVVDIINVVFIGIVLGCGCDRGGVCEYVSSFSSFVFVSLALQATFLLGALWSSLSITLYMFKTVSSSFFYSFLSFSPVIVAFICSFYRMYNEPSGISVSNGTKSNSSEENFNNFHSTWDAAIKTLVMTTGEFEAASINYDGGKWLLFIAFLFIAPIVILNLINGLAVSDITDIRKESEFISVYKKVRMLERYERAIVESRSTMSGFLQCLFCEPLFPSSFFENYESIIYVMVNEKNKLAIKSKKKENSTKKSIKNKASCETRFYNGRTCNDTGNERGEESNLTDKNTIDNDAIKSASKGSARIANNDLQLIPVYPWLPNFCFKYYIGTRWFQWTLYSTLDQSFVNKAKIIERSISKNNSGRGTNELADMEQADGLALVKITLTIHNKALSLSSSTARLSKTNSQDAQNQKLKEQMQNIMHILSDI